MKIYKKSTTAHTTLRIWVRVNPNVHYVFEDIIAKKEASYYTHESHYVENADFW